MKKKIALIALLVILLASIGYGTYAYTTVEGRTENVITTSGVHIALVETREDGSAFPEEGVDGILPGSVESKIVKVKNTGPQPAWVRLAVDFEVVLADGTLDTEWYEHVALLDTDVTNWELDEQGRYFYYMKALEPGETTTDLFKAVDFATTMGNRYQDSTFHVKVRAEATQSANNGDTVWEAAGWPTGNHQ